MLYTVLSYLAAAVLLAVVVGLPVVAVIGGAKAARRENAITRLGGDPAQFDLGL